MCPDRSVEPEVASRLRPVLTPWGTVLTGEENFHQYFANLEAVTDERVRAWHERYGLPEGASDRKWERYHDRFDLAKEPHEPFRFGWVVEVDPYDPDFTPPQARGAWTPEARGGDDRAG